ncbi:MAG: metalloprotease PmbA, partial [Serpentinimonas sp.]|nr:metalloprotease PmbA [Serpentinimonas sp.]
MKKSRSPAVASGPTGQPSPSSSSAPSAAYPEPEAGFQYHRQQFEALADLALQHAKGLGAVDAAVEISEGAGLNVSVRMGELENVERNRDKALGVT